MVKPRDCISINDKNSDSDTTQTSNSDTTQTSQLPSDLDKLSKELSDLQLQIDDTLEDAEENNDGSTLIKGSYKDYQRLKTFPSLIVANEAIANREIGDQLWTRGMSYATKAGDKICFTCRAFPRCPKRMQLHLDPTSQEVHASVSLDEHSHARLGRRPQLDPRSKAKVLELLDNGMTKPKNILSVLEEQQLPPLTRVQINNLKQRLFKKTSGPLTCSLSEFLQWVKSREAVPEDEDQVFVSSYQYKLSKTKINKIKDLRCFMTTKRLLRNATQSMFIL